MEQKEFRGSLTLKILEAIGDGVLRFIDVWIAVSSPQTGFGTSIIRTQRYIDKLQEARSQTIQTVRLERADKQRLSKLIYKLNRDGLIKQVGSGWRITKKGLSKKEYLESRLIFRKKYKAQKRSSRLIFVIFDIPEKIKPFRDWLRSVLKNLDFQMLQESVWVGKSVVPQELIEDLSKLGILQYIHIFTVGKSGTLEDYLKRFNQN